MFIRFQKRQLPTEAKKPSMTNMLELPFLQFSSNKMIVNNSKLLWVDQELRIDAYSE